MGQKEGVKMNTKIFELQQGEKPLDNIKENCGFAGIFKEIGVIGDSLSSGEFELDQMVKLYTMIFMNIRGQRF